MNPLRIPPCSDPSRRDPILEAARGGRSLLDPKHIEHCHTCASCRVAVERMRVAASAWRALGPSDIEVNVARSLFVHRSPSRRRGKRVPRSLALVVLFTAAAASAAVVSVAHRSSRRDGNSAEVPAAPRTVGALKPRVRAPSAPPEPLPTALAAPAPSDAPGLLPPPAVPAARVRHSYVPATSASPPSRGADPSATSPAEAPEDPWVVAAAAMRARDYDGAARAFAQLALSPDARTRDAARLARAEVLVAQGRADEVRADLEDLAANGATPSIRQQSADDLRRAR